MTGTPHPLSVPPDVLDRVDWSLPEPTSRRGLGLLEVSGAFWARANSAREEGDEALARAYDVLGGACRMRLDPEDDEAPLRGGPDDPLGPSFMPAHLPRETADSLDGVLDRVDDLGLRARLADVVHAARGRDYPSAERAARMLGEAALDGWEAERERPAARLIERALQLTGPYGPKSTARGAASDAWTRLLDRAVETGAEPADVNELLVIALKYTVGEAGELAPLSEQTAERAEALERWHLARQVWATTSDWWHRAGEPDRAREARVRAAATHEREADRALRGTSDVPNTQAVDPLSRAVIAYRQAGETARADEVHRRLQEAQRAAVAEIGRFGSGEPIDVSEPFAAGADAVRGLPVGDALIRLATLYTPSSRDERLAEAAREVDESVLADLWEDHMLNGDGKLTARGGTLWDRAVRNEAFRMRIVGAGLLAGARRQFYEEHALDYIRLYATLMHSPWVPAGREGAYTRALLAGYRGDRDVMVALLAPQVEHSVRVLLHFGAGKSTSSLDDRGIQKEYGLAATLSWAEAEQVLGADVTFALRVLLVDPMGHNLRNRAAHGLIGEGELDRGACEYLWWLVVRLCLCPPPPVWAARTEAVPESGLSGEATGERRDDTNSVRDDGE